MKLHQLASKLDHSANMMLLKRNVNIYGIGLPRTGTNSLASALNKLGINGENYCVLHNHKQEWNPCQQNSASNNSFSAFEHVNNPNISKLDQYEQNGHNGHTSNYDYKFFVENDAYQDIEQFIDDKLSECEETKFILTHRANEELWKKSVKKIETKMNHDYESLNIPDPLSYKQQVVDYFKHNNNLDNLLILDLFQQHQNQTILWKDICQFLEIDLSNIEYETDESMAVPHVNL